jgi:endonuclease/exonuclease/phosphatase family metal-dependent hydrolase
MPPRLEDLVVVTWNAHLAEGRLSDLIAQLHAGALTDGQPVRHFVLLLQELFRRGPDVPPFGADVRSAFAIKARDPKAPDANAYATALGLSLIYVPSMRNGPELREDRGNAIVSTEPLIDPIALELPFERQRRVAIGASVQVRTSKGVERLNLLDVHLEPLSAPSSLWIFRNPRRRQVAAVLDLLRTSRFAETQTAAGTVLGGDFNTIQGGVEEDAYQQARAWATSLVNEDRRPTHYMGRLDYLFFKLADQRQATTVRLNERFGSDHYPVLGRITADTDRH